MVEELTKHEKALLNDLFRSWNHATKHVKEVFIDRICEIYDRQGDNRATSKANKATRTETSSAGTSNKREKDRAASTKKGTAGVAKKSTRRKKRETE